MGSGVSYVYDGNSYNYDTVVFQKGKPPLDSELNLVQQLQGIITRRQTYGMPSGWLTLRKHYTSTLYTNQFYTQDPSTAIPEYALVNGHVIYVTNTGTTTTNANIVNLGVPPSLGNQVNGVFLEMWRALLSPGTSTNKPNPAEVTDALMDVDAYSKDIVWTVGGNGLILYSENGGLTWTIQTIETKRTLNGVIFYTDKIGWVVGDNGTIARTTSGGVKWSILTSGTVENLNGISAYSQTLAWVVGDAGTILKTTNGVTWVQQISGVTDNLKGVYFYNNQVGWIVGNAGTILKTTDAGAHWTKIASGTTVNLSSVYFYDLNWGFAVGASGTILKSCNGGLTWTAVTSGVGSDLTDITMIPNLDEHVINEEVTSQFDGTNKNCSLMHAPITKGNGIGEITNTPSYVTVTVDNVAVAVDSLDGTNGQVILASPPHIGDTVKVTYWYRIDTSIFRGKVWVTGKIYPVLGVDKGVILRSDDVGATWTRQDPQTGYDLNAVTFVDDSQGWLVGNYSTLRHTVNGGSLWSVQASGIVVREVQRVFNEGNVGTSLYLTDDSIHPDANIETTKRIQVQYRIRVVPSVDPLNYPDSGLGSQIIYGNGPSETGQYPFVNMGSETGDYGLWRAKCANTVDGYTYAVPMFFVNRRNIATFNPSNNINGSSLAGSEFIRPDQLMATNVVDADVLDTRRLIVIPSITELLKKSFDSLMNNDFLARIARETTGGDHYGVKIMQMDRVSGTGTDGGYEIPGATLSGVMAGDITSKVEVVERFIGPPAVASIPDPIEIPSPSTSSIAHYNSNHYSAIYYSSTVGNPYNGKPIPGYFTGQGTSQATFVFSPTAKTSSDGISEYHLKADYITTGTTALTHVPTEPLLVKNYKSGNPSYYYQGVLNDSVGKIIEQWDSGITGYSNYVMVYPGKEVSDTTQQFNGATTFLHYYIKLTASDIDTPNKIKILNSNLRYSVRSIAKVNNITSGFSFKIKNITYAVDISNNITTIFVESLSGYSFVEGLLLEIIAPVFSQTGSVRTGSSVNFNQSQKGIDTFCISEKIITVISGPFTTATLSTSSGTILGVTSAETSLALAQPICWLNVSNTGLSSNDNMVQIKDVTFNGTSITILFYEQVGQVSVDTEVIVQVLTKLSALPYPNDNTDGLMIGYNYTPYQSVPDLPTTLTVEMTTDPSEIYISDLGTGGSLYDKSPYNNPLVHIPLNNPAMLTDDSFYSVEQMRFPSFSIDNGYVKLPVRVPGSFGKEVTFSTVVSDTQKRAYYSACSKEALFTTDSMVTPAPRKIFLATVARVTSCPDEKFLKGEYVMVIFSRSALMDTSNYTGYKANDKCTIAIYRLMNRPLSRI